MAEGSVRSVTVSTDGEMVSPYEDDEATPRFRTEGQGESAMTASSQKKSRKKKSKYEQLEEKWDSKFNNLDSKIDNRLDKMENLVARFIDAQKQSCTENGDKNSADDKQSQRHVQRQNSSQRRVSSPVQVSENEDNILSDDDNISLQPGQAERQVLDSESEYEQTKSDDEHLAENTRKCLFDIFGDDAIAKKTEKKKGIELDNSQKEVLKGHWRAEHPKLITAFAEETKESFPIDEDTEKFLEVPSLDELIGKCLVKKHGSKASFSKIGKTLHTQPFKMLEKIAYRGQQAAFMGIIINMYMQQSLASLIETLSKDKTNDIIDNAIQQIRDIFAMSTKSLDQMGRTGAFHHILRRQMCLTDTSLYQLEDSKEIGDLPLSADGVFGEKLETFLKSRKEKNKALEDLLPDLYKSDRKRKSSSDDKSGPSAKRANVVVHQAQVHKERPNTTAVEGFRIPKKSSTSGFQSQRKDYKKPVDGKQHKPDAVPKRGTFPPRGGKAGRQ